MHTSTYCIGGIGLCLYAYFRRQVACDAERRKRFFRRRFSRTRETLNVFNCQAGEGGEGGGGVVLPTPI